LVLTISENKEGWSPKVDRGKFHVTVGRAPSFGCMKKKDINIQDWKKSPKKGFPYKGIDDPKYIADRKKLFDQNGNGWWWYQGTPLGRLNGD